MADPHPTPTDTPDIEDLRRRMALGDPDATRQLCQMSNTPVPGFARQPTDPLPDAPEQLVLDLGLPAA